MAGDGHDGDAPDRYSMYPDLMLEAPRPRRLYGFDWQAGYVSPFRETPAHTIAAIGLFLSDHIAHSTSTTDSSSSRSRSRQRPHWTISDLGCGTGTVLYGLAQQDWAVALVRSGGLRFAGIDLDLALLQEAAHTHPDMASVDLWHGDMLSSDALVRVGPAPHAAAAENAQAAQTVTAAD
ncbi:hypothetical protein BC831DRAFT_124231 [Entophlyctis helioformis]|nr:hypothetical protein BC831DRAFT_124231 [Entophlyctis helioformis]